jgi:hypothetical protein
LSPLKTDWESALLLFGPNIQASEEDMGKRENLRAHLRGQPAGEPPEGTLHLLAECWKELKGSGLSGMTADKLRRVETFEWVPPLLTFTIERHGAYVNGSTRASVQHWQVNVEQGTAELTGEKRRQLDPMDKRLNVRPIAEALADAIERGAYDDRFHVSKTGNVRLNIGKLIPHTNNQTTSSRRKRLRAALAQTLTERGWKGPIPQ